MASFRFIVKDQKGDTRKGILQAPSLEEAQQRLLARGYSDVQLAAEEVADQAAPPPAVAPAPPQPAAEPKPVPPAPVPMSDQGPVAQLGAIETTIRVLPALPKANLDLGWRKRLSSNEGPNDPPSAPRR